MGGFLSPFWDTWQEWGAEDWVFQVLRDWYRIPFLSSPPLSPVPAHLLSYYPSSIRGKALAAEIAALSLKGAIEPAPPTPGYYSRIFVVMKASGSWRPIIDLSCLNRLVVFSKLRMETPQSVLRSVRTEDWMVSVDLQDAYLQIPVHQESRRCLRFVADSQAFQFRFLCFGLTTAPQVFTRVMARLSAILHRRGYRLLRYLDDWLVLGSSLEKVIRARDFLLELCSLLGIRINQEKSNLTPSQYSTYLGMMIQLVPLRAFLTAERIGKLSLQLQEFLSSQGHPAHLWPGLLGKMSSMSLLIPGSWLQMRSLQLFLKWSWDFKNEDSIVAWDNSCLTDLQWWSDESNLTTGVPLEAPIPDAPLYTDASNQGWGGSLDGGQASGLWSMGERQVSINHRELLAVERSLSVVRDQVRGIRVALFLDNTAAIAYLKKVSDPQFYCSVHLEGLRVLGGGATPSVHCGFSDRPGGHAESGQPSPGVEMDSVHGGVPGGSEAVVCLDRSYCDRPEPPAACVLLSRPGPHVSGDGRDAPVLGRPGGLCLSPFRHDPPGPAQAEAELEHLHDS